MVSGSAGLPWQGSTRDRDGWAPVERDTQRSSGGTSRTPLPPCVYVFRDTSPTPLYVGKAGSNPGDRIKAHFDGRKPWALAATRIELNWLPFGADLDAAEQALIRSARPKGNRQHNRSHHDAAWARHVELAHARAVGADLPVGLVVGLWVLVVRGWLRRVVRTLVTVAIVDLVIVLLVVLAARLM